MYEEMDIETYLAWLATVADESRVRFANSVRTKVEEWVAKDENWRGGSSNLAEDAIHRDVEYIVRYGKNPACYQSYLDKQARAVEKRKATRARTVERYGSGKVRGGYVRDSQREKMYRAERASIQNWDGQRTWKTVPQMQAYVNKLLGSAWWKRRWPEVEHIEVRDGGGRRSACSEGGVIKMPLWSRKDAVILHEIAHEVIDATIGYRQAAPHGREFCQVYLELVGHQMGADARKALKAAFQKGKVKHTKARPPMSPEQREAAAARLAACRQAS